MNKQVSLLITLLLITIATSTVIDPQPVVAVPVELADPSILPIADDEAKFVPEEPQEVQYTVQKVLNQPFASDIIVTIKGQQVSIKGCNTHSSQYRYFDEDKILFGFDPFRSTRRACEVDQDQAVVSVIQISSRIEENGSNLYFYDITDEKVLSLVRVEEKKPVTENLDGKYTLKVGNTPTFSLDGSTMSVKGCNTHNFQYMIVDGILEFGPIASTKIACPVDNDSFYINVLQKAVTMKKQDNGDFKFFNKNGNLILTAVLNEDKKYNLQLPSLSLMVQDGMFSVMGCNNHRFNYKAYEDGTISFGPSSSTEKACMEDHDHVFLTSLLMSSNFEIKGHDIVFKNEEEQELVFAQKNIVTKFSLAGEYHMEVVSSVLPTMQVTINDENISFQGCNSNTVGYKALSDGTISFTPGFSTLRACEIDNDQAYVSSLLQSESFEKTPQGFVFKNENGRIIINLISSKKDKILIPVNERTLSGTYNMRLSGQNKINTEISVEISPISVKVVGCNIHSAEYNLYKDGGFELGSVRSTRRFCMNDVDGDYVNAFVQADLIKNSKDGLVLSNQQGDLAFLTDATAKATSAERYYYSIEDSYRQFEGKYIVRAEDEVIPQIKKYVIENYSHFLDESRIIGAFRWYLLYKIRYEVLFRTLGGTDTFNVIMDYDPEEKQLELKSLVLIDFTVLPISRQNCKDMGNSRCKECYPGYEIFRGRCHRAQKQCELYDPEECFKCAPGYLLQKGKCSKSK